MSKLIDLTGQRFNRLTVLYRDTERKSKGSSYWICRCDCGKIKSIKSSSLRRGEIQSCGCLRNEHIQKIGKNNLKDLTGQKFGLLTVLELDREAMNNHTGTDAYWKCKCECGNIKTVKASNLTRKDENRTISCGCSKKSSGEIYISNILTKNKIPFIYQYRASTLSKQPFDFGIIDDNNNCIRLIEFDGEQHFKDIGIWDSLEVVQERDKKKNEWAKNNNIPLVRIPYWEKDNITIDMIMGDNFLI